MKKLLFLFATVISFGALGLTNPVEAADLNSFYIKNYDMQMKLSRDSEDRSTLETTEAITAQFSQLDVNRGLERAIPRSYDGHPTNIKIQSVQDGSGGKLKYSTRNDSSGNMIVRIGDPDAYVHGEQQYVISYTQRDVTRYFEDTKKDEFYWDTNGTEWKVPIQNLKVSLEIDDSLKSAMTGDMACYQGASKSTTACQLVEKNGRLTTSARGLSAGANVTVAVGFKPETFAKFEPSLFMKLVAIWHIVQVAASVVGAGLLAWFGLKYWRASNRVGELGAITPEYIPPSHTSVTTSAKIAKGVTGSAMTAQLIDLAVRHYIKLYEVKEKSLFRPAEYEVEIARELSDLLPEEQELLKDMFGSLPGVSQRINLKKLKNNSAYFRRTSDNDKKLTVLIREDYELQARSEQLKGWFKRAAVIAGVVGVLTLSPLVIIAAGLAAVLSHTIYPLTDKGLALRRYLEGLKLYIGVAEKERLKMLQSPDGAQKVTSAVGGTDHKSLLKLYERVLPYAVLFNQEKEWSKSLGQYYEQAGVQPDWYVGQSAFNAAMFTSAISNISQASSYASSSSSSSGGSGGGGFSGGGGGGGGGGGW